MLTWHLDTKCDFVDELFFMSISLIILFKIPIANKSNLQKCTHVILQSLDNEELSIARLLCTPVNDSDQAYRK